MIIDEQVITIKTYSIDISKTIFEEIIQNNRYPQGGDLIKFGYLDSSKIGKNKMFQIAATKSTMVKSIDAKKDRFAIIEKKSEHSDFGYISYIPDQSKLIFINCSDMIRGIFLSLLKEYTPVKIPVAKETLDLLLKKVLILRSTKYSVHTPGYSINLSISSNKLDAQDVEDYIPKFERELIGFAGKTEEDRLISMNINRNGNVLIYNSPKDPLEWEDIFSFIEKYLERE